ncbi:MAG: lamin tail domain-containing protein, partial [Pirellulales bacterium]
MRKRNSRRTDRGPQRIRSRRSTFECLEPRYALDGSVVINEIMYHPDPASGSEADFEWVELYNQMSIDMDISGWRLEGAIQYTFAEGTVILGHGVPGNGYMVIASNPTALAGIGATHIASGSFTGRLDNSGEEIRLVNRDGRLISVVEYSDSGPWPVGPDGSGFSLAKLDQFSASSDPASWRASRQVNGTPGTENFPIGADPGPALVFNEIPAASSSGFWIEIANQGTSSIDLTGYQIKTSAGADTTYTFSAQSIGAGQILLVDQSTLGFGAASGDKLYFYSPSKDRLLDTRVVTNAPRGLEASHDSEWLYPVAATPGAANSFQLNTDIVINEIMYHAIPNYPVMAVTNTAKVVGIDATTLWRYNKSGSDLGTGWATTTHPVGGSWQQGPAVLGFDQTPPAILSTHPIRTSFMSEPGSVVTTYYETDFNFSGNLSDVVELALGHVIDDGAVFYLNGVEVLRYNMPTSGTITSGTFATTGIEASYVGPVAFPKSALVVGLNRLSVEVHQVSSTTDVLMGAELFALTDVTPAVPFSESPEEWVELYNKGSVAVDLSGWKFADGFTYTIPNGTIISAGGYLVVAKDAAALQAKYPSITIVGNFSGSLSNSVDNIVLTDVVGNPVDNVRYYDSANWHEAADGGGSSLELRSPHIDNTRAESWAPSIEGDKSDWNTYTYTMVAASDTGPANVWKEFLFGFIQSGEMLIDDVTVTSNPGAGNATQLIQNGTFEGDAEGTSPLKWRIIGNHGGTVILDPTNSSNKVLRLVATGRTDHEGNNAGTTLAGNTAVVNGTPYQISFRAKWISGSPQINSRLYFNRVSDTIAIEVPHNNGTPGAQNSTFVENAGPTYSDLKHGPVVPVAGQPVTVSVRAEDPDGIASMTLYYSVEEGAFNSVAMTVGMNGLYTGTIPGQAAGVSVQFYVQGEDIPGAISMFPAAGPNSRAMYEVNDGIGPTTAIDSIRIVARASETGVDGLLAATNLMSNQNIGATIIYNNSEVFYDVGIRLKGSSFSRGDPGWGGSYTIEFNPDHLFRGVYEEIALDSTGRGSGSSSGQQQVQILVNQIMNHAGNGLASNYDDFVFAISPNTAHTGIDTLQLARYGNDFLDESYVNGSDGNVFEYEIVYYSTMTIDGGVESPKNQNGNAFVSTYPQNIVGDDADRYRWNALLKNNRDAQDFSRFIEMSQAMSLSGTAFIEAISSIIDVDQWLRTFAAATVMGISDTFATMGNSHNIAFYVRPSDNKVLMLPWDWDESFRLSATSTIFRGSASTPLPKLLTDPSNYHTYLSHLYDIVTHEFTTSYMTTWVNHFHAIGQQDSNFLNQLNYINTRHNSVLSQINIEVPATTQFNITTNNGNPHFVDTPTVTLNGTGYVDSHTIRVRGSSVPLEVTWSNKTTWQAEVPLSPGENDVILDAYDVRGNLVHSDSITVTTTANVATPLDSLRITEMNYHPANPP